MLESDKLDQVAKRRCLMLLEVLSGRVPVTEAITKAKISRGTYYQLETKALMAMLDAMTPGSSSSATSSNDDLRSEIDKLISKVDKLTADKRRLERLLQMTKKMLKPGSLTTGRGAKKRRQSSAKPGKRGSPSSATKTSETPRATKRPSTSTPTGDGVGE